MTQPSTPREHLAVELREQIVSGAIPVGGNLPGIKQLARERGVSPSTVHRAFSLLRDWGLIDGAVGERARVLPAGPDAQSDSSSLVVPATPPQGRDLHHLGVRLGGTPVARLMAEVDPRNASELRRLLLDAIQRRGDTEDDIGRYELDIQDEVGHTFRTFVASTYA
jgi:DNA-binding FadR family transcriptional regulator